MLGNAAYFEKCGCEGAPYYLMDVKRLKIGYVILKVKCLECGKEFEIYTQERKTPIHGIVCKSIDERPYKIKCDYSYEDVKEAYDLLKEQTKGKINSGDLVLAYHLRRSFDFEHVK